MAQRKKATKKGARKAAAKAKQKAKRKSGGKSTAKTVARKKKATKKAPAKKVAKKAPAKKVAKKAPHKKVAKKAPVRKAPKKAAKKKVAKKAAKKKVAKKAPVRKAPKKAAKKKVAKKAAKKKVSKKALDQRTRAAKIAKARAKAKQATYELLALERGPRRAKKALLEAADNFSAFVSLDEAERMREKVRAAFEKVQTDIGITLGLSCRYETRLNKRGGTLDAEFICPIEDGDIVTSLIAIQESLDLPPGCTVSMGAMFSAGPAVDIDLEELDLDEFAEQEEEPAEKKAKDYVPNLRYGLHHFQTGFTDSIADAEIQAEKILDFQEQYGFSGRNAVAAFARVHWSPFGSLTARKTPTIFAGRGAKSMARDKGA